MLKDRHIDNMRSLDWQDDAACKDVDVSVFYPEYRRTKNQNSKIARKWCHNCPVKVQCLLWAMANNEKGVWGDTSEKTRGKIRNDQLGKKEAEALVAAVA